MFSDFVADSEYANVSHLSVVRHVVCIYMYMMQTKHNMGCSKVVLAVNETITKLYVLVSTVNKNERKYYRALGGKKISFV